MSLSRWPVLLTSAGDLGKAKKLLMEKSSELEELRLVNRQQLDQIGQPQHMQQLLAPPQPIQLQYMMLTFYIFKNKTNENLVKNPGKLLQRLLLCMSYWELGAGSWELGRHSSELGSVQCSARISRWQMCFSERPGSL